jgi:hypothetical protein
MIYARHEYELCCVAIEDLRLLGTALIGMISRRKLGGRIPEASFR